MLDLYKKQVNGIRMKFIHEYFKGDVLDFFLGLHMDLIFEEKIMHNYKIYW